MQHRTAQLASCQVKLECHSPDAQASLTAFATLWPQDTAPALENAFAAVAELPLESAEAIAELSAAVGLLQD